MKKAKISPEQEAMDAFEKEFDKATEQGNHRIVFVKRCPERNPKVAPKENSLKDTADCWRQ